MVRIDAHPIAEKFPMMADEEYATFKEDIRQHGLLEPLWLLDGKILDGRNRYRACTELGVELAFRQYQGNSPIAFVWSLNGARRQLGKSQLATIAVSFLPEIKEEAQRRMLAGKPASDPPPKVGEGHDKRKSEAVSVAASIVGVGKTLVQEALVMSKASPELFQEVASGKISLSAASKVLNGAEHPKRPPRVRQAPEQRIADIARLAASGHNTAQIASEMSIGVERVRLLAGSAGIVLHGSKGPHVVSQRIVAETVAGIENYVQGLSLLSDSFQVDPTHCLEWVESLTQSIHAIKRLKDRLQGLIA